MAIKRLRMKIITNIPTKLPSYYKIAIYTQHKSCFSFSAFRFCHSLKR